MTTHKDLDVWNESIQFVTEIYSQTSSFPSSQRFGLTSQIERASCSIPSNIAEGYSRSSNKERIRFLYYALSSNTEVETQLIIASKLNFLDEIDFERLRDKNEYIGRMLVNLIRHFKKLG